MAVQTLIVYIVILIVLGIAYKVLKSVFKGIAYIAGAFWIILMIIGIFVYADATELNEKFAGSEKLFLLDIEGDISAGFYGIMDEKKQPKMLTQEQVEMYDGFYKKEKYASILGSYYKVFIFNESSFSEIDKITFNGYEIDNETLMEILASDNAAGYFSENVLQGLAKVSVSDDELKGNLFAMMVSEGMKKKGSIFLVKHIQTGNVQIYPESAMFKFIRYLPTWLLEDMSEVMQDGDA